MKVSASVYMTLQVVVHVGDWEAAQSFEELHKAASREARQALDRALDEDKGRDITVSGEPAVMHVVTKQRV